MVTVSYPVVWKLLKSLPTRLLPGVATRLTGYAQVVEILIPGSYPVPVRSAPHTPLRANRPLWGRDGRPLVNKKHEQR